MRPLATFGVLSLLCYFGSTNPPPKISSSLKEVSVVVHGPHGIAKPIHQTFYQPNYPLTQTEISSSYINSPEILKDLILKDASSTERFSSMEAEESIISRHIRPSPSLRGFKDDEIGPPPLREAVEYNPKKSKFETLFKSNEKLTNTPFSRQQVEALPSNAKDTFQLHTEIDEPYIIMYSTLETQKAPDKIGYRGDVESLPDLQQKERLAYFRGGGLNFEISELQWMQDSSDIAQDSPSNLLNIEVGLEESKKVVCYYESWAMARPKPLDFSASKIDPFACSHINFAYAGLDEDSLTIASLNPTRDITEGAYKSIVSLKARNPNLKVLISIGGWLEGGAKYSRMVSTEENRNRFIDSVVKFLKEHNFDGLDFDWEFPGATDRGGTSSDKENFALLVEQMYRIFKENNFILSIATPIAKSRIYEGFDLLRLSSNVDFFNLMAFDLRGHWDGYVDHHAPLTYKKTDKFLHDGLNLEEGLNLFERLGVPKAKMVIGVPFYGKSFTLYSPEETMPGAKASGAGKEGRYTQEMGYVSYFEICMNVRNGDWNIMRDESGGPYMVKDNQWIGYDDEEHIKTKVNLIKQKNYGGVMLWAIDLDDFLGMCGKKWPLISTVRETLFSSLPVSSSTVEPETSSAKEPSTGTVRATTEEYNKMTNSFMSTKKSVSKKGYNVGDACTGFSKFGKAGDCGFFLTCLHGSLIEQPCPPGLHWNDVMKICDWPDNAKCSGNFPVTEMTTDKDIIVPVSVTPEPVVGTAISVLPAVPTPGPLSGDYMVVCYFTNWAWYRPGIGKFIPDDIDVDVCTHIVYGFAVLDSNTLLIKPHDSWADLDNKFYERVTSLKAKGKKVTVAIGGWNDSAGNKYSRLVNNPSARTKFINHVVGFITKYKFDGLDLDWEYPVCWQVACSKGPASDKIAFGQFVKELSEAFRPRGLLLSAAVSPSKKVIDAGYDVPVLNKYLDWIAVMTYDFHGHWDKKTGHVAPLYYHPEDDYDYFNMDFAINYWIKKGAQRKKVILGMPLYGQSFTLNDPSNTGLNSPASKGLAGEFTRAAGFLAYYEICDRIKKGWRVVKDDKGRMGPYAFQGSQWVSFDDVNTIKEKSRYIREMGLGGGMIWALDLDDFNNRCGQGPYPLMKTIQLVLGPARDSPEVVGSIPSSSPSPQPQPEPEPEPEPTSVSVSTESTSTGMITESQSTSDYKVVCYYTNWSWYRQSDGKYLPEDIDPNLCTHINYGFIVLDSQSLTMKPHDRWADIDNNFYTRVTDFKKHGIKVLAALGGWNDSRGNKYSRLVNDPQARKKFNSHALEFLEKYGFDGLDLDWEYPKCWQVDCSKGPASDKQAFIEWIKELNAMFKPRGLLLTAAVSPSYKVMKEGYDVPAVSRYLDFINVMTYDYHGQWDKKTGHVAPMYVHPEDEEVKFNTNFTINHWIELGADPKKLILGMPMYGQSFTLASNKNKGLNQKSYGGGEAGPYTRARGFLAYYEICYFIKYNSWNMVKDPLGTMGPYAYRGSQWVGFDDVSQIRYKSQYVKKMGLGGAMIWALDLDDFRNRCDCEAHPLLKTINRELRGYPQGPQCILAEETLVGGATSIAPSTQSTTSPATLPTMKPSVVTEMSSPEPISIPSSSIPDGLPCVNGQFRSHPECSKFYECYEKKFRVVSCGPGLHWDGKKYCVFPSEANCKTKRVEISPPTIFVETPKSVNSLNRPLTPVEVPNLIPSGVVKKEENMGQNGQACSPGEYKRHPDCDKFYECVHSRFLLRSCPPGLHWNGQGMCTWPDRAKCRAVSGAGDFSQTQKPTTKWPVWSTSKLTTRRPVWSTSKPTTRRTTSWSVPDVSQTSSTTQKSTSPWYVPWTPSTKPTTPRPTHPPGSLETDGYKVVCYFTNWAWYRRGIAKYRPEDIDPDLCTHIIYGFAVLDASTLLIKPHDTWADYDNKFYEKVTGWKAKGIRVLLAIGGWNDSRGGKYSKLVNNPAARAKFTQHVVKFLEKHNFDGLDLDWEYPKCWQVDCKKGPDSDKEGFSAWMRELKAAFKPRNWLLTAAVSPSYKVIDAGYHVPDLNRYLDFINVMTYDYHGHWDKKTGHVAPLYHHPKSTTPEFNANYTINYFIRNGADPKKLIMGMPLYGQAFTISKIEETGLNSPGRKGQAGEFTRAAGFLAYYEICDRVLNRGYDVVKDENGSIGPYAFKGNQWVGFDDVTAIRRKSEYIKKMGLGGGMIWALDLDDFNNGCGCEPHPLLRTINRVLRNYPSSTLDCSLV